VLSIDPGTGKHTVLVGGWLQPNGRATHRPVDVREDPEREVVLLCEAQVLLGRVEGGADDLGAELLELWGSITEPLAFQRSAGGIRLHEPPEGHPVPSQVGQGEGLAVLVREREVRRVRSFREHRRSLREYPGRVIEVSEWARDILSRSQAAARRFNPDTVIRLVRTGTGVEARLAERAEPGDQKVHAGDTAIFVEAGLEGLIDIEEPHDRIVLKPPGSSPNLREPH
jgi:hypothetical protein